MPDLRGIGRLAVVPLMAVMAVASSSLPVAGASGTSWVDDDGAAGPSGCRGTAAATTRIQPAIDAAEDGATIMVCPGTYKGSLRVDARSGLTLRAVTPRQTRIVPSPDISTGAAAILITSSSAIIVSGFDIGVPSGSRDGKCVYYLRGVKSTDSTDIRVVNNHFWGGGIDTRDCGLVGGVFFDRVTDGVAAGNVVRDFEGYGIWTEESTAIVRSNQTTYDHARDPIGDTTQTFAFRATGGAATFIHNAVRNLSPRRSGLDLKIGIVLVGGNPTVENDTFQDARTAILVEGMTASLAAPHPLIKQDTIRAGLRGIVVRGSTGVEVRGNSLSSVRTSGIGVSADSGGNAFVGNVLTKVDVGGNLDCVDRSAGAGSSGTANTWTSNRASGSMPRGICRRS